MWYEELKWFFEEGTPNGFNDGGIAEFTSTKYDGLAREIIQNSIDAKNNNNEPVRVVFEQVEYDMDLFPDYNGLLETINKCIEFIKDDIGNKSIKKLQDIKAYLEFCKQRGSFIVLKVSDYNTSGLRGANKKIGTTWSNLVRISGNSNKKVGSGGSFGIGKYAPFVFSNIRSIIYSTKDEEGNIAVQGKSILSGHQGKGNFRTPNGYFGEKSYYEVDGVIHDDSAAILDTNHIPNEFIRKEIGTTINILCASLPVSWIDEVESAVVNSFFYAIFNGNLEVEIIARNKHIIINSANLVITIEKLLETTQSRELAITLDYLKMLDKKNQITPSIMQFILPNGKIGTMELYLYSDKTIIGKSIAHLRKTGMKIEEKNPKSLINYTGIAITTNEEMNEFLTNCEAPKHDAWSSNNYGNEEQQLEAKKVLNILYQWERDELKKLVSPVEIDKIDPFGMEEYLPSDIDGENESQSQAEIMNFKPLKTKIETKKNSKQTYTDLNSNGIIEDELGEEKIEKSFGHNNSSSGTGEGNGQTGGTGTQGGGHKLEVERVKIKYTKTPYINNGKYLISFIPIEDKTNCELKVRLAGDDIFENLEIEELYLINGKEKEYVKKFDLIANKKIIFEAKFKNVDRGVLEVTCYAKK